MLTMQIPGPIVLHKEIGQTPLQAIEDWKRAHPQYAHLPATYAGRLDPMAEGVLLVLLGNECKRKDAYLGLDKEYEVEVLLDLTTDTKDVLGMPAYAGAESRPDDRSMRKALRAEQGSKTVPYPSYSSKTVDGTPLFLYALGGTLDTVEIPMHTETIYRIQNLGASQVPAKALEERVMALLDRAPRTDDPSKTLGQDFRQDEIRAAWKDAFSDMAGRSFAIMRLRVTCASGTYMRSLADRLGRALDTRGMALSIRRTRIGTYRQVLRMGSWVKQYR